MIHHGDCITVMAQMAENSVDAVVTDPPYGLEFMGKEWDSPWKKGDGTGEHNAGFKMKRYKDGSTAPIPNFTGSTNPTCRVCGGTKFGNDRNSRERCNCEAPIFPNTTLPRMLAYQQWCEAWAREAFRVAKPGAYLLAFGGTRTVHRLACAIEDAGWEIRDELVWVYASGFPKSLDVSKALDKVAGAERPVVRERNWHDPMDTPFRKHYGGDGPDGQPVVNVTAPATDLAKQWEGWGTALKPAHEPIVMARKPLVGSVAANVTRYGTGALNIGATRIPGAVPQVTQGVGDPTSWNPRQEPRESQPDAAGRWPSNLLLSDPELFDVANPGVVGSGATDVGGSGAASGPTLTGESTSNSRGKFNGVEATPFYGDSGGYSRFFIVPKADRADREPVLRGQLETNGVRDYGNGKGNNTRQCRVCGNRTNPPGPEPKVWPACGHNDYEWVDKLPIARENAHPTVKPTDLMAHLIKMVTPPGGVILDPFLGSGSTAIAAERLGVQWVGIEKEAEYVAIAEARLNGTQRGLGI